MGRVSASSLALNPYETNPRTCSPGTAAQVWCVRATPRPIGEVILIEEAFADSKAKVGEAYVSGIVTEADPAVMPDAVVAAWMTNRFRCSLLQPKTSCSDACKSAMVLSLRTSSRRQISGLTPRRTTRSWYTTGSWFVGSSGIAPSWRRPPSHGSPLP